MIDERLAKRFISAIQSETPLLLIGQFVSSLKDSNASLSETAVDLRLVLEHFLHPCSLNRTRTDFDEIVRELNSHISRLGADPPKTNRDLSVCGPIEQWISATDDERSEQSSEWDAYSREGLGYALVACGQLAIESRGMVVDALPGIYHGGSWVINAYVRHADLSSCPPSLKVYVLGFPVCWIGLNGGGDQMGQASLMSKPASAPE
ncbi:hypothetical protein FB106_1272 [Synechococcus sp. Ace-Pa]|nr:hypothetical protein FB106_1272 [Synechococcus sp. Ace-Pa]